MDLAFQNRRQVLKATRVRYVIATAELYEPIGHSARLAPATHQLHFNAHLSHRDFHGRLILHADH